MPSKKYVLKLLPEERRVLEEVLENWRNQAVLQGPLSLMERRPYLSAAKKNLLRR